MGYEAAKILPIHDEVGLTAWEEEDVRIVTEAAENGSFTDPYQSDYHVKAAGMAESGRISTGGNEEKTHSDAWIHGETSVLTNLHQQYPGELVTNIGFFNGSSDPEILKSVSPCGPCRDTLIQGTQARVFGGGWVISSGNSEVITAGRLRDYMKEDGFEALDPESVDLRGIAAARLAITLASSEYLPESMRSEVYGVSLVSRDDRVWRGGLHTTSGYNEVSPGYNAVTHWLNTIEPGELREDLDTITVVRFGALPLVEYRDRQVLLELDEVLSLREGRDHPLPVELLHLDPESGEVVEAAKSDTLELLPRPFSARAIGLENLVEQQAAKIFGMANVE